MMDQQTIVWIHQKYQKKDSRVKIIDKKNEAANKARNGTFRTCKAEIV